MPSDGYTPVTSSDSVATKLTRIMMRYDRSSSTEAITYAAETPSFMGMKSPHGN
jgi:hypothetical protein